MSRYTVLSTPEAEDDLATMWTDADDRKQVSEAANAADRLLAENPLRDSVYLSEQLRRLDVPPLRFYFEVRADDRVVVISNIVRVPD
jgi:ParE toxin of type II toxin-antitoxin system, parDE